MPCLTMAQKKELSQARSYIKSSNYTGAEQLMTGLLKKDSASRDNKRVYLLWYEAVRGQYNQANERMYLKQQQDTAAFFNLCRRMFTILEKVDSLEMRPDKKGKVNLEHRKEHSELLHAYRPNIFAAGSFHLRKLQYKEAFSYFETYIDCARQPLFSAYRYDSADVRMPEAGYWATYCAYKQQDPVLTLRHRHLALRDSSKAQFTLQYIAEARRWLNDEELYVETLEEGFRRFPTSAYFFPRLYDAYTQQSQLEKALALSDSALAVNDSSELFLFAKSTTLLRLERYEESVKVSEQLIALNDSLAEVYFNAGTAYLVLAQQMDGRKDKDIKKQQRSVYEQARKHMERYRQLAPDERDKWAPALYRIYLNLNMGRQFDEIDRLLKQN
jgi:tetratricopeptide (TPR) repeat protein